MKKRTIWLIAAAVVVVLLVTGGIAGWNWHKQPTFCSSVCHKVMASYVGSWQGDDKLSGTPCLDCHDSIESWKAGDKLAAVHGRANIVCLDCHESTLSQQLSEVQKYVTGNYKTPLDFTKIGDKEFCLECHGTYDELAEKTRGYDDAKYNPHDSHNGELECYDCHRMHSQSVIYCSQCHTPGTLYDVPSGWAAVKK
jgi:hypothetical protein